MHVAAALARRGDEVIGLDNFNDYYDPQIKRDRAAKLVNDHGIVTHEVDLADEEAIDRALAGREIRNIVHLGAQVGVRYSIENPRAYAQSNLLGHLNILELARARQVRHLVYASSSSVYGGRSEMPFSVEERTD